MPKCRRCERVQASAEVRRTTLGHVCKENTRGTPCWTIARALAAAVRAERRAARREAMSTTERGAEKFAA